ncbi:MAG: hypothetical protein AAF126_01990 [Chloroflexota bacterium]
MAIQWYTRKIDIGEYTVESDTQYLATLIDETEADAIVAMLNEQKAEIERLQSRIETLMETHDAFRENAEAQVSTLKAELEAQGEDYNQLAGTHNDLTSAYDALQAEIEDVSTRAGSYLQTIARLQADQENAHGIMRQIASLLGDHTPQRQYMRERLLEALGDDVPSAPDDNHARVKPIAGGDVNADIPPTTASVTDGIVISADDDSTQPIEPITKQPKFVHVDWWAKNGQTSGQHSSGVYIVLDKHERGNNTYYEINTMHSTQFINIRYCKPADDNTPQRLWA